MPYTNRHEMLPSVHERHKADTAMAVHLNDRISGIIHE